MRVLMSMRWGELYQWVLIPQVPLPRCLPRLTRLSPAETPGFTLSLGEQPCWLGYRDTSLRTPQ